MDSILPDIQVERQHFPALMNGNQCVELLNRVAWKHRDKGWGLAEKTSGNRGRRSDGVECSVDGLVHGPTNTFVDVLVAAADIESPGEARPAWQVGAPGGNIRAFVAPIQPGVDTPPPPPPPDNSPVLAAIADLARRIAVLEGKSALFAEVFQRLAAVEGMEFTIVPDPEGVSVGTSRSFGHAHTIRMKAVKK